MVTVEIFEDLQCKDCTRLQHLLEETLLPLLGEEVEFVRRDFPLAKHPEAFALAAEAHYLRATEGRTAEWEWRKKCLLALGQVHAPPADRDRSGVDADLAEAHARGVAKTPPVVVGNHVLIEHFTAEELLAAIRDSQ
ncbi:MAG: thioredoxin domain-containing protein [bacterium]